MNEYQQKRQDQNIANGTLIEALLPHLPAGWTIAPQFDCDDMLLDRWTLSNRAGDRKLVAMANHYGHAGRFEFRACHWPTYTDEGGNKKTVFPSDVPATATQENHSPRGSTPTTTAAIDREPKAVAKQIERKIFAAYDDLFTRCEERAASSQTYHDTTAAALEALGKATGDPLRPNSNYRYFYIKGLPGDPVRLEFQSVGDVRIGLTTEEAIDVIALLWHRRQPTPPQSDLFPVADWQYEVANGDTRLGYAEWLDHRCEANET